MTGYNLRRFVFSRTADRSDTMRTLNRTVGVAAEGVDGANDGLASARARGRVGERRPRLTPDQAALAQRLYDEGEKTVQQIADMFGVPRSTVYGPPVHHVRAGPLTTGAGPAQAFLSRHGFLPRGTAAAEVASSARSGNCGRRSVCSHADQGVTV
ncbi:helix-turn-helix domain-containing protein [Streptomyces sp. TRM68367]|uniref:helix-turn-helix domain-containing protein n=1 Tax=Streptomyces sp. TRM68367 TaxID=2758415 RepID=UPI0021CFF97B|nr:helix-turn-helix domain-containing protein [Streptomyces sp. TRM68367]